MHVKDTWRQKQRWDHLSLFILLNWMYVKKQSTVLKTNKINSFHHSISASMPCTSKYSEPSNEPAALWTENSLSYLTYLYTAYYTLRPSYNCQTKIKWKKVLIRTEETPCFTWLIFFFKYWDFGLENELRFISLFVGCDG